MGTNKSSIRSINKAIIGTVNRGNSSKGQRATNPGNPTARVGAPLNKGTRGGADRTKGQGAAWTAAKARRD